MTSKASLNQILKSVLQIDRDFNDDSLLLGAIAEFDSMAVIAVITELEDQLGLEINDDDISAEVFASFGSLYAFVESKST
jgi:acyl carrier protein